MGTLLYAQVEVFYPANENRHTVDIWLSVSHWELQKYYELSTALERRKNHVDYSENLSIQKIYEYEYGEMCRLQIFNVNELRDIAGNFEGELWPQFLSLMASLGPLYDIFKNERVRILFWRDQ